jgi:hypothetical protein
MIFALASIDHMGLKYLQLSGHAETEIVGEMTAAFSNPLLFQIIATNYNNKIILYWMERRAPTPDSSPQERVLTSGSTSFSFRLTIS